MPDPQLGLIRLLGSITLNSDGFHGRETPAAVGRITRVPLSDLRNPVPPFPDDPMGHTRQGADG
jgi:hypothetical protein